LPGHFAKVVVARSAIGAAVMLPPSFPFLAADRYGPYKTVELSAEPSSAELSALARRGIDGVLLLPRERSGGILDLGWLSHLNLRFFQVQARRRLGGIPAETLRDLEVLWVDGTLAEAVQPTEAPKLRSLAMPGGALGGDLTELQRLEFLALERLVPGSPRQWSGSLDSLRELRLGFKAGSSDYVVEPCLAGSPRLESVDVEGATVASLDEFGRLPRLRRLSVQLPRNRRHRRQISLAPLTGCPMLEELLIADSGRLLDAQVLDDLPHLRAVTAYPDGLDPWPGERDWLREL